MRICTWNVNGLRAALNKRFQSHMRTLKPDVLLMQEIRVMPEQLPRKHASPRNWNTLWNPAQRKGYAGTAVWSREDITRLDSGMPGSDEDGRILRARVDDVEVVSVYLPSGSAGPHRQEIKEQWLRRFMRWARPLAQSDAPIVLGGDFNIAHTERDIYYAKGNAKNSGFLPHERRWMGRLIDAGWADLVREHFGEIDGPYSWWSNRGSARQLDRGWRIDYLLANEAAATRFQSASIHRPGGIDTSDHAPVVIDLA